MLEWAEGWREEGWREEWDGGREGGGEIGGVGIQCRSVVFVKGGALHVHNTAEALQ